MNKNTFLIALFTLSFAINAIAQTPPKREFRGVWVATVANIDFPSSSKLDSESQKREWIQLMEDFKAAGMNAVVAQIRPAGDAFYPSELVPWSKYLTGKQGSSPVPFYDPLSFMIEEAHKRGIEFHAWLNPYRATMNLKVNELSSKHKFKQNPDWFVKYGGKYYFNPGEPEVINHINEVVKEIVEKYDVDAIHFDDYFYPYKVKGQEFPDQATYEKYGKEFFDIGGIGDWRRHNVDLLIEKLSETIQDAKPWVRFGISPFGVWRNKSQDPVNGSDSRASIQSYDDLNADVLKWLEEGWIDYVAPQLYWYIGLPVADHKTLIEWWNEHTFDGHLYIGHAAYKVGDAKKMSWLNPKEMSNQIALNRATPNAQGSIYFSARSLKANKLGVTDSISYHYRKPALLPAYDKYYLPTQSYVRLSRAKNVAGGAVRLAWKYNKKDLNNPPLYYVIYRFEGRKVGDFEDVNNIVAITEFDETKREWEYFDNTAEAGKRYTYVVKPVNKLHQEGRKSRKRRVKKK
jgi:uncharacterized lipoprotein YddW (UPF0748 family)